MRHGGSIILDALGAACAAPSASPGEAEQRLLALHEAILEAHRRGIVSNRRD